MNDLKIGLRLLVGAGTAADSKHLLAVENHIGIQRVRWTLARFERIRLARIKTETAQPVVHHHAGITADHTRAKGSENTLYKRDSIAIAIRGAQIRGIAA